MAEARRRIPHFRAPRILPVWASGALLAAVLSTACSGAAQHKPHEVLPAVEVDHAQAVRTSVAEVPGGELVALGLRHRPEQGPVWRSEIAAPDGTVHQVRVDATLGNLLGTLTLPDGGGADARARVERAVLLPEEAVREVTEPDFGKVNGIRLGTSGGAVIWNIDVVTVENENVHTYDVDAMTGEVLSRSSAAPERP